MISKHFTMEQMKNYYDAIIIGSGLGGLSCGNFLAKHGIKVLVLEQHFKPGGYATSYKRKGYNFDVAHVINGVKKGGFTELVLSYLGMNNKIEFDHFDITAKQIGSDKEVHWHADFKKYQQELISKFPLEEEGIKKCFVEMKTVLEEMKKISPGKPNFFRLITYPFRFPKVVKYHKLTFKQFADQFIKDEKLKFILGSASQIFLGLPSTEVPALNFIYMLLSMTESLSNVKGGFQQLADAFVEQLQKNGGQLILKERVKKILIEKNRATGVMLEDGRKMFGKYIISNADSRSTFLDLVGVENLKDKFVSRIKNQEPSMSGITINLVVKMDLPEKMKNCAFVESFSDYDNEKTNAITSSNSGYEFTKDRLTISALPLKPEGESEVYRLVIFYVPAPYDMWVGLDKKAYKKLKEEISEAIIQETERRLIPNLSEHILIKDVSTPLTYERYTSAYKGCWYDAANTFSQSGSSRLDPKTPIKGLRLVGAKTLFGGGLVPAIQTGAIVADMILKGKVMKDMRRYSDVRW